MNRFPQSTPVPASFIAAEAHRQLLPPFSTATSYPRATLPRSLPIPPKRHPTTFSLLTTRDPTKPLCSGLILYRQSHRLVMLHTKSRMASSLHLVGLVFSTSSQIYSHNRLLLSPSQVFRIVGDSRPPRCKHARPLFHCFLVDATASYTSAAPHLTYFGNVDHWEIATTPRHRRPFGGSSCSPRKRLVNSPFRLTLQSLLPLFKATLAQILPALTRPPTTSSLPGFSIHPHCRTQDNDDHSFFANVNKPTV